MRRFFAAADSQSIRERDKTRILPKSNARPKAGVAINNRPTIGGDSGVIRQPQIEPVSMVDAPASVLIGSLGTFRPGMRRPRLVPGQDLES
jgi:hypothetical protein